MKIETWSRQEYKVVPRDKYGWDVMTIITYQPWGPTASTTETRVNEGDGKVFLDVAITEYTGESRRAKSCGVRLNEEATRALYLHLRDRFEGGR